MQIENSEEVKPGEVVIINDEGLKRIQYSENKRLSYCIFELIYFSRPDSNVFGYSVYDSREKMGGYLAKNDNIDITWINDPL